MKNKRGASLAIEWVLLVGLSVSLAVFVGVWLRDQASGISEGVTVDTEVATRCADTIFYGTPNCADAIPSYFISAGITNSGSFSIKKVKCNGEDRDFVGSIGGNGDNILQPEETLTQTLSSCNDGTSTMIVIPFIEINGEDFGCAEKSLRLEC